VDVELSEISKRLNQMYKATLSDITKASTIGDIPDIMDLSNIFEWSGITLGREEMFSIFVSIKQLVVDKNLKSSRLFGKFYGLHNDYLVVESERRENDIDDLEETLNTNADEPVSTKKKKKIQLPVPKELNTVINKYIYWVSNFPGGQWTRLPDVLPKHVQVARKIRKFLTGNLTTKVN
jgi:radial spoke head protein 4A